MELLFQIVMLLAVIAANIIGIKVVMPYVKFLFTKDVSFQGVVRQRWMLAILVVTQVYLTFVQGIYLVYWPVFLVLPIAGLCTGVSNEVGYLDNEQTDCEAKEA